MEIPDNINVDLALFTKDLSSEDELGAVIRAHIRIENLLLKAIESLTPRPKHLKKLNLDYDGQVTLALALGLKERFGPPFRALGKLRNDFAHKIDMQLSKSSVANLYSCLGAEEKEQVQECFIRIKDNNEEIRRVQGFTDLEPIDQFKLITVTLWAVAQAVVLLFPDDHSAET